MKNKKKILIVTNDLSYPAGAILYAKNVTKTLWEKGFEISIWTNNRLLSNEENWSAQVQWIENQFFFKNGHGILEKLKRVKEEFSFLKTIRGIKPNICLVIVGKPRLVYKIAERYTKVVFYLHEISMTCPGDPGFRYLSKSQSICEKKVSLSCLLVDKKEGCLGNRPIHRKIQRVINTCFSLKILQKMKNLIANSSYTAKLVSMGVKACKPEVVYPFISLSSFLCEDKSNFSKNLYRLAFIGRLEKEKGALEAVHILALLPDRYTLIIIGEGSAMDKIKELSVALGVAHRLTLTGWLDRKSVYEKLFKCGVVIMPSLCAEGFGRAGFEALLAGTPVVAYNAGGIGDWCRGEFAQSVAIGDRKAVAQKVLNMTEDYVSWLKLSKDARRYAENYFNQDLNTKKLINTLRLNKT